MTNEERIEANIDDLLEEIEEATNDEERMEAIKALEKLYKLKMDYKALEEEHKIQKVNSEERIMNILKIGVDLTAILAPLAFYGVWMRKGFEYEKTGRFSTDTFRWFGGKVRPTK